MPEEDKRDRALEHLKEVIRGASFKDKYEPLWPMEKALRGIEDEVSRLTDQLGDQFELWRFSIVKNRHKSVWVCAASSMCKSKRDVVLWTEQSSPQEALDVAMGLVNEHQRQEHGEME